MTLRVFNTLRRAVEPFVPGDPARITFYSCGLTVYDDGHIGNFRSFLAADLLRRWLESPLCPLRAPDGTVHPGPRRVVHAMNITDVGHMTDDAEGGERGEDRMQVAGRRLLEAKKSGRLPPDAASALDPADPRAIASYFTGRFREDARALGLKVVSDADADPRLMPRATENVDGMIVVVRRLISRGHAYAVGPEGRQTVYFDVQSFPPYGRLSGNTLDALRAGAGGRVSGENQAQKRHPADFLLWKHDPSHVMKWDSPWGAGYPGWHIECTVMSVRALVGADTDLARYAVEGGGPLIDIHSGGEDNIFPHHECEIAQSCGAFNGAPADGSFARLWFHPRFLLVNGEKMSKSRQNFFTARDLFARGVEPGALRLELVRTHYRSNANFTEQGLRDGARMIERWRRFLAQADAGPPADRPTGGILDRFSEAMNDDLNAAAAIGELNSWINSTPSPTRADAGAIRTLDAVLGVLSLAQGAKAQTEIGVFLDGLAPDPGVLERLIERRGARERKDFHASDRIRDELLARGYAIKDVPGGKVEVRKAT